MDGESEFLVPKRNPTSQNARPRCARRVQRKRDLPFGRLAASNVRRSLLGLLAQSSSAVGILLADRLSVGQILGPVDYENECADFRAVNAHVGEDAGRVHAIERVVDFRLGRHAAQISSARRCCLAFTLVFPRGIGPIRRRVGGR